MGDRIALVTGAGRGIGAAVARRLSAAGHRVALTARSADQLAEVAAGCPGETCVLPADITAAGAVERIIGTVAETWGDIDILVANAGGATSAPLHRITDEQWAAALELNLTAPFRLIRALVPGMRDRRFGRIVVIASVAGKVGEPYIAAYTASKHGVLGLVRSAAAELAGSGVTVNAVCPGYVDTPMTQSSIDTIVATTGRSPEQARELLERKQPIGRLIRPDEVADAVSFCLDSAAVTGQAINIDGGAVQS